MTNLHAKPGPADLADLTAHCLTFRLPLINQSRDEVIRLFNGFNEGRAGWVVDLYATNLVISHHLEPDQISLQSARSIREAIINALPWVDGTLFKQRHGSNNEQRRGVWLDQTREVHQIVENSVRYAIDLRLNQDNSFYPDTRLLREWLGNNLSARNVLNTFAYSGTLGIAALGGGASEVIQTDLNPRFLAIAQQSAVMNGFENRHQTLPMNFFTAVNRFKSARKLFDCVILDPPYFSTTKAGKVDLLSDWHGLINKVRPLVGHEGFLVLVNNALYASGAMVMEQVNHLESSGYFQLEALIDVPVDCRGFPETIISRPPTDPAPFTHPTKIVILRAARKDQQRATP